MTLQTKSTSTLEPIEKHVPIQPVKYIVVYGTRGKQIALISDSEMQKL